MQRILPATLASLLGCAGVTTQDRTDGGRALEWQHERGRSVALLAGDDPVWRLHFATGRPHVWFHPLALPDTSALTVDRPADHVWHHGLWFSWKFIDGVNYWEHERGGDRPAGRTRWTPPEITTRTDHTAGIRLELEYAPGDDADAVLVEERVLEVSAPAADGSFHIDWTGRFTARGEEVVLDRTPLPGEPGGRVYGGYAGLSLRLTNWNDRRAATLDGVQEFNDQNRLRTRSPAFDYSGRIGGRTAGIAVLTHPDNLNAPSPWYAIRSGHMSFFTPAVLCYGPETLARGEEFTLRYRIVVHPGRWDADRLDSAMKDWTAKTTEKDRRP